MEKGLLEERRGHRAGRTGWRPAALPFFHPGEPRKVQRAEARVTGWIMEKAREFQKNIYFCFIDYAKAFDCVDHNKLWKILT